MITLTLYASDKCDLCHKVEDYLHEKGAVFARLTYADAPLTFEKLRGLPCLELRNHEGQALTQVYGFKPNRINPLIETQRQGGQVHDDD